MTPHLITRNDNTRSHCFGTLSKLIEIKHCFYEALPFSSLELFVLDENIMPTCLKRVLSGPINVNSKIHDKNPIIAYLILPGSISRAKLRVLYEIIIAIIPKVNEKIANTLWKNFEKIGRKKLFNLPENSAEHPESIDRHRNIAETKPIIVT